MLGDSTTSANNNTWPVDLARDLSEMTDPSPVWVTTNSGVSATGAGYWVTHIAGAMANKPAQTAALVNLGVNDFGHVTGAQWIADMETVLDAMHAAWPEADIYLMRPWKRGYDATANLFAGYIDTIIAAKPYASYGPDERVWLKGSDDGATNTYDGIHYSAAGEAACVAAWKHGLGF